MGNDTGTPSEYDTTVVVDEEGVLARWADWQAHAKGLPVAAMAAEGERPEMFVANELLVDANDPDLARSLVEMGATIIEYPPMMEPPEAFEPREVTGPAPIPFRLRFDSPPEIDGAADTLTEMYRAAYPEARGLVTITSEAAARVAALAARLAAEGHSVSLNMLGSSEVLPVKTAQEMNTLPNAGDPLQWPQFSGRSRIVHAWQLVESFRAIQSVKSVVWIAILDGGFWIDANNRPLLATGQTVSDFGGGVLAINLQNEQTAAGGVNPNRCSGGAVCNWHGNGVASAALAAVGNSAGAAGAGGTVALPVFFRSTYADSEIYRALQICAAWGIDVLNMSFGTTRGFSFFGNLIWEANFTHAFQNGVIMVAAAGNGDSSGVGQELPGYEVRPATRTPGIITVGALDANDNATSYSNYGDPVAIWAPGNNIPVAPDGSNPNGSQTSGTSLAAPLVAGVAAMMRAVNPMLTPTDIRNLLVSSAWGGNDGRVTRGLDAYAAVLAAMGGSLPADYAEENNTPATAALLIPTGPGGALQPLFNGSVTHAPNNADYYRLDVHSLSNVTVNVEWYNLLGRLFVEVQTDDPLNHGPGAMTLTRSEAGGTARLQGLLAPGYYRIRITGPGHTGYSLNVTRQATRMPMDMFEPNDSFEQATQLIFEPRKNPWMSPLFRKAYGPGTFQATLHADILITYLDGRRSINPDYFELRVPESSVFHTPTVTIADTDHPLDATLYDSGRQVIGQWTNQRQISVEPPGNSTCYLVITGRRPTRYSITTGLRLQKDALPGPHQKALDYLPKWWGDPGQQVVVRGLESYYAVSVGEDRGDGLAIAFERPGEAVRIQLLDREGNLVFEAEPDERSLRLDTSAIQPGTYLLRVAREDGAEPLELRMIPPI